MFGKSGFSSKPSVCRENSDFLTGGFPDLWVCLFLGNQNKSELLCYYQQRIYLVLRFHSEMWNFWEGGGFSARFVANFHFYCTEKLGVSKKSAGFALPCSFQPTFKYPSIFWQQIHSLLLHCLLDYFDSTTLLICLDQPPQLKIRSKQDLQVRYLSPPASASG